MAKYFWIFFILLLLWMVLGYFLCKKFICSPTVPIVTDSCAVWDVNDGKKDIFDINSNVHFVRSNYKHLPNYTSVNEAMTKMASYLSANKDRALTITGLYNQDERNSHNLLPNLGLARADDIKSWLESKNVNSDQIDINHRVTDASCYKGDTLRRGVEFAIGAKKSDDTRLAAIKDRLFGKPINLYFNTGSDNPNITPKHRQNFADLFYYLDKVGGSQLDVDGHTDNVGNVAGNTTLSQNRAMDVRNYISINGGVDTLRMNTNGYGPTRPIAPNDTPANKALNRRVEVTLK